MTNLSLTREQIEAVYASGPAAVVALVEQLQQTVGELSQRVSELEERVGRNSRNSSQPPSTDGFNRPSRSLRSQRQPSGNKPGGQRGHKGHTLPFSANPDRVVVHRPQQCAHCGCCLLDVPPSATETGERHQVTDLPALPLRLETVEHWALSIRCPQCAGRNYAPFPAEAAEPVQYGPRIKAIGVYLMSYQLVPYERTRELLTDLFGASPSEGTLYRAQQGAAQQLGPVEEAIRKSLQQAQVAHFDETGLYIGGKRHWLHVAGTQQLTLYLAHKGRGEQATRAMGVLPNFGGVAVHDGYRSFWVYDCRHALCNAHHLRELTAEEERSGGDQQWPTQLKGLLGEIKAAVEQAQTEGRHELSEVVRLRYQQRYRKLLAEGLELNPPNPPPPGQRRRGQVKQSKAYNLLMRLRDQEGAVLRFMVDFRVPFDNNQAERDLRMAKVQQKVSGCFRSQQGATAFCRIRGYISTLRKQGPHVLNALEQVFRGAPVMPCLPG